MGKIFVSPDGIRWSRIRMATMEVLKKVKWVNGIFLVVGEDKIILSSDDGISWEQINIEHSDVAFNDVVWNGKEYLIVGDKMRILTSEEGVDWEYNDDYMEVLKKSLLIKI